MVYNSNAAANYTYLIIKIMEIQFRKIKNMIQTLRKKDADNHNHRQPQKGGIAHARYKKE